MSELKICRICLRTESKVYNYEQFQLKSYYEEVLALKVSETDELPHYFCFECATLLHKFHKFKEKCYTGQKILKELLRKGPAGKIELSKFSTNMTRQESEVKNPFLETDINVAELPVLNHDFNSTDPVEIDSFFVNNFDVVLEDESMIENASLSKICDETPNKHSFQKPSIEPESDLSKNINIDLNVGKLTENDQLPIVICELPSVNDTFLESDLGYEDISSNLAENLDGLDDNDSSMLYSDLPSISQAFDETNIDFIEGNLDLSGNNDIDTNLVSNSDLTNASQKSNSPNASHLIKFIETGLDLIKKNDSDINDKRIETQSTSNYHDPVQKSQEFSESIRSQLSTEKNNIQLCYNNAEKLLMNESKSLCNDASKVLLLSNLEQTKSYSINKNKGKKVRIASKNQVAPNIHSLLPATSREYFETVPEPDEVNIGPEESLKQLQVEPDRDEGSIKKKRIRNRRKRPFSKQVRPNPCHKKCGNDCSVKLTEVDRLVIHERYWKMNKSEQQDWLLSCIRPKKIGRRQGSTFAKNITYHYYISHKGEDIRVCQQFLMKTLDVSQMRFRYVIAKHTTNEDSDSNLSLCSHES
ncbi:uncharacterized protein [Maniola hyperantus]|uniref:uncharacterized protein isoform X2 n=1 Tax=Aphantopus hyperantus TaxID=2795564 RepID=UPI0021329EDB